MRRMDLNEKKKIFGSVFMITIYAVVFIGVMIILVKGSQFVTGQTDMEPLDMMKATGMIYILGGTITYLLFDFFMHVTIVSSLKRRVKKLEDEIHGMDEEAEEES